MNPIEILNSRINTAPTLVEIVLLREVRRQLTNNDVTGRVEIGPYHNIEQLRNIMNRVGRQIDKIITISRNGPDHVLVLVTNPITEEEHPTRASSGSSMNYSSPSPAVHRTVHESGFGIMDAVMLNALVTPRTIDDEPTRRETSWNVHDIGSTSDFSSSSDFGSSDFGGGGSFD